MDVIEVRRVARRPERLAAHPPGWLERHSVTALRISLGAVFLGFGLLKFVPGLSPAEDLAGRTMTALSFGLVPDGLALYLVAAMETAIGLSLVTGRWPRIGLALLGVAMVGVLSPLVLFPDRLFGGPLGAPPLEGQYVLKDIVLLATALVVAARECRRGRDGTGTDGRRDDR